MRNSIHHAYGLRTIPDVDVCKKGHGPHYTSYRDGDKICLLCDRKCDCGAIKVKTTHAAWCSAKDGE